MAVWGWNDIDREDGLWAGTVLDEREQDPQTKTASLFHTACVAICALCIIAIALYAGATLVALPQTNPTLPTFSAQD
jgi:hypothetical protein